MSCKLLELDIMEPKKLKSVRIVSILIMAISAFMTIGNLGGAFMSKLIEFDLPYYFEMCIVNSLIGVTYFIGGFALFFSKRWARLYLLRISMLIVLLSTVFPIFAFLILPLTEDEFLLKIASVMAFFLLGIPLFFLSKYLLREGVKRHCASA